jgi:hypothetical protein
MSSMASTVVARRPRGGVVFLSLLADVAAITYLTIALTGCRSNPSSREQLLYAGFAIYGLSRLVAAYGLRHLTRSGVLLERLSAWIWIAASVGFCVYFYKEGAAVLVSLFLPGVVVSIAELIYLRRPSVISALFVDGPGLPMTAATGVGWGAVAVTVALLSMFFISESRLMGRSKQKRTMADMRTIATAWEARDTDFHRYNAAAVAFPTGGVAVDDLAANLSPTYVREFPRKDGWGNNWQFGADQPWGAGEPARSYAIISYGKDGQPQRTWAGGAITNLDCDIIYSNGTFIQYPEGISTQ